MQYNFEVNIRLKTAILDPQGQAIKKSAHLLAFNRVTNIRIGKHIELTVEDGPGEFDSAYDTVLRLTEQLLYNPIIEEYDIKSLNENDDGNGRNSI